MEVYLIRHICRCPLLLCLFNWMLVLKQLFWCLTVSLNHGLHSIASDWILNGVDIDTKVSLNRYAEEINVKYRNHVRV